MTKKVFIYFVIFITLTIVNFFLYFKIYNLTKKEAHIKSVLAEIAKDVDPKNQFNLSSAPTVLGSVSTEVEMSDGREANLKSFFRKYNSPLYDYAALIVQISDLYHFDYRLLPAIAMQESTLCRVIPDDSHNCWGWGIYGTTVTRFDSYEEAIQTVALGIKKEYLDKGLVTASAIMEKYTPSSNGSWQHGVNWTLRLLD